jgi:hypothetical protein
VPGNHFPFPFLSIIAVVAAWGPAHIHLISEHLLFKKNQKNQKMVRAMGHCLGLRLLTARGGVFTAATAARTFAVRSLSRRPMLPSDRQKRKEKKFVVLGCSCWHRRRASRPLRQLTASVLPPPLLLPLLLLPLLLCLVRTAIPSFRLSGYFTKRLVVVVAVQSEVDGASRPRVALLLQSAVFDDGHRTRATATATRPPTP